LRGAAPVLVGFTVTLLQIKCQVTQNEVSGSLSHLVLPQKPWGSALKAGNSHSFILDFFELL
jgi:hypothetical protein